MSSKTPPTSKRLTYEAIEALRTTLVPLLDALLRRLPGDLRVTTYSYPEEYAATVHLNEPALETWLEAHGFTPNLLSAYKHTKDGRASEGSWACYPEPGWQLHVTIYPAPYGRGDRFDCYAHWEKDPRYAPIDHYRAVGQDAQEGVRRFRQLLDAQDVEYHVRGT